MNASYSISAKKRQQQWLKLKCCLPSKPKYLSAAVHAPVRVLFGLLPTARVIKKWQEMFSAVWGSLFFLLLFFFQWEADPLGLSWMCLSILLFIHPWAKKLPGNKQYWLVIVVCGLCNYTGKWQCVICLLLLHPRPPPLKKKNHINNTFSYKKMRVNQQKDVFIETRKEEKF